MKACSRIKNALKVGTSAEEHPLSFNKSVVRRIVSQQATGNVSLQRGKYLTEEEIDERRNNIRKYRFVKR